MSVLRKQTVFDMCRQNPFSTVLEFDIFLVWQCRKLFSTIKWIFKMSFALYRFVLRWLCFGVIFFFSFNRILCCIICYLHIVRTWSQMLLSLTWFCDNWNNTLLRAFRSIPDYLLVSFNSGDIFIFKKGFMM